jgi:hypothetical protein
VFRSDNILAQFHLFEKIFLPATDSGYLRGKPKEKEKKEKIK